MNKQIKQLGSNHQLLVRDTKTGKTFVINKDDASLGGGLVGFPFIEGVAGFSLAELDVPLFFVDGEDKYLSNYPLTTAVTDIYNNSISNTITTDPIVINYVDVRLLGSFPIVILDNIPSGSALKGYILIKYIPGTTAYDMGTESAPTFRFKDHNDHFLWSYTAAANNLLGTTACHWIIPLESYLENGRHQSRVSSDLTSISIQMYGENEVGGPLDPTLGDGDLEITVVYEIITIS